MSASDPAHNLRKSVRCTVVDKRQRCKFIVGKKVFPVQLYDESLGGFAVLIDSLPHLYPGDHAQLLTDHGLFDVRLVRITKAESSSDNKSPGADETNTWYQLGLCRIGEALPSSPKGASIFSENYRLYRAPGTTSGIWLTIGLILVLLLIAVPLGITFFPHSSMNWKIKPSPSSTKSANVKFQNKLSESIQRTPGASALILPDVKKELGLSDDQIEEIRQLMDTMSKAIRQLDLDAPSAGLSRGQLSDLRNQMQQETRGKAIKLLTPEQQQKWEKLNAEP
jgi:hypothetical protein